MPIKSFNRSDLFAFTALLMSMLAVFVSIYEAKILKEQQMIMLSQEKTAVWPYVKGLMSYKYSPDKIEIKYTIENKGIGPSKIRKMALQFNGREITDYLELIDSLGQYFPDSADLGVSFAMAKGEVLSPNESLEALSIESKRFDGDLGVVRNLLLHYDICYCSVYDECWSIKDDDNMERELCD
jgi:hypothetical protein